MSTPRATLSLLVLAATLGVTAIANAQTAKTREQVQAELAEAIRSGNIVTNGESGLTLRELNPQRYGAVASSGASREQVLAELKEAQRSGALLAAGEAGVPLNQLNPQAYPPKVAAQGKTRTQVEAELREALRTGNMVAGGESGQLLKDLYPQRYANVAPTDVMQAATPGAAQMR
jgi:predicted RNase H-like HicB family nuclease